MVETYKAIVFQVEGKTTGLSKHEEEPKFKTRFLSLSLLSILPLCVLVLRKQSCPTCLPRQVATLFFFYSQL